MKESDPTTTGCTGPHWHLCLLQSIFALSSGFVWIRNLLPWQRLTKTRTTWLLLIDQAQIICQRYLLITLLHIFRNVKYSAPVCSNNSSHLNEGIRPYNYRLYRVTLASAFVAIYLCFVIWFRPNKKSTSMATTDQNYLATTNRPNSDNLPKISGDHVITHF